MLQAHASVDALDQVRARRGGERQAERGAGGDLDCERAVEGRPWEQFLLASQRWRMWKAALQSRLERFQLSIAVWLLRVCSESNLLPGLLQQLGRFASRL